MANVLFTTRKALTDTMSMVSASTATLSTGLNSMANYASMMEAHSLDAKTTYVRALALGQEERLNERLENAASAAIAHHEQLDEFLNAKPGRADLYERIRARYAAADARAVTQLTAVAAE